MQLLERCQSTASDIMLSNVVTMQGKVILAGNALQPPTRITNGMGFIASTT